MARNVKIRSGSQAAHHHDHQHRSHWQLVLQANLHVAVVVHRVHKGEGAGDGLREATWLRWHILELPRLGERCPVRKQTRPLVVQVADVICVLKAWRRIVCQEEQRSIVSNTNMNYQTKKKQVSVGQLARQRDSKSFKMRTITSCNLVNAGLAHQEHWLVSVFPGESLEGRVGHLKLRAFE